MGRRTSSDRDKPLVWLHGELKTPPLSQEARIEAGLLLRRLQRGDVLSMPESRPMPSIGSRCHELRITDTALKKEWRVLYCVGHSAIGILEVFQKTTSKTPIDVIQRCKKRLSAFQLQDAP